MTAHASQDYQDVREYVEHTTTIERLRITLLNTPKNIHLWMPPKNGLSAADREEDERTRWSAINFFARQGKRY